jgi:hypothetical protein
MQAVASFILIAIAGLIVLAGILIAASMLGAFLLPLVLVGLFLLAVFFTKGLNMSGWQILIAIPLLFMFGYGVHLFLGSTIGYDPVDIGYMTGLSVLKLSTVGPDWSDSTYNMILGFSVIFALVIVAILGMFRSQMRRKR